MIRVILADDHDIVRMGLRQLLGDCADLEVVGEAASLDETLALVTRTPCDVVVLDIGMPGGSGTHAVQRLLARDRAPRIVVFTMYNEDSHAIGYLRAGVGAFINKRRPSHELVEAIRKVHAGGRYITPTLAEYLFEHQIDVHKGPADLLSDREMDVVRALASGKRATEIAGEWSISSSTVNTYVQRIKTKIGARTAVEIVDYARTHGMLG